MKTASKGTRPANANEFIEQQLDVSIEHVEDAVSADALSFCGNIVNGIEDYIRDAVEAYSPRREKLFVILETPGGFIEVTQRIADTFRHHYKTVDFIIPNFAMSAGTVLVMSGDNIYMDYFSVLGPIDPQVERQDGKLVPALGYLEKYKELIAKSASGSLTSAEIAFLVSKFDPAELYQYEQAKALSDSLLKEWLVKYKFKDWNKTKTRGVEVTPEMKEKRAQEIADKLNDTKKWNSHARGISMQVLIEDLNLQIEDFGSNQKLNDSIKEYHRLFRDYMAKRGHVWAIHTKERYIPIATS